MTTNARKMIDADVTNRDEVIAAIASEILGIEALEARNSDRLDFHEVAVWQIAKALTNAYAAGRAAAIKESSR